MVEVTSVGHSAYSWVKYLISEPQRESCRPIMQIRASLVGRPHFGTTGTQSALMAHTQ